MTEFTLIRHGETAENLAGIIQGHYNSKLNDVGLAQAEAVAARLHGEVFDACYTSDLQRAVSTAEAISKEIAMDFVLEPEFREWNLGVLEQKKADLAREEYPEVMDALKHAVTGDVIVPQGENHSQFHKRVCQIMEKLAERHAGQRVLIVTHGGVLREVFALAVNLVSPANALPLLTNTGYTKVRKNDLGEWQLCVWTDASHLESIREQKAF